MKVRAFPFGFFNLKYKRYILGGCALALDHDKVGSEDRKGRCYEPSDGRSDDVARICTKSLLLRIGG